MLFPPAGEDASSYYRKYEINYAANTKIFLAGYPELTDRNVEEYVSSPITGTINRVTDEDVGFPFNTFKAFDDCTDPSNVSGFWWVECQVPPYVSKGPQYWKQPYAEFLLNPIWKVPTIFNIEARQNGIVVTNIDPRQPIELNWIANIQDIGEVQIWQSETLIRTIEVGANRACEIPAYTIQNIGQITLKIVAANNPIDDLGVTGTASITINSTVPPVTASSFKIDQTEKRSEIVGTWESTNQSDFKLEVLRNDLIDYVITGGTEKYFKINPGTLKEGEVTFKLTVNNTFGTATTSVILNLEKIITLSKPNITGLEPDQINQNIDSQIEISWSCVNQDEYTLKAYQNDILIKSYNGNVQKNLVIPAKTFKIGSIKLELTCYNTINGITAVSTRVANFLGYGKPETPVFNPQEIYNQAKPTFLWDAPFQVSYKFEIWKDSLKIEETEEIISSQKEYTTNIVLQNNSKFLIKVKVKNQFNLWSDFAEKEITVSYTVLPKPEFDIVVDGSGILITMLLPEVNGLKSLEIWRKDEYTKWTRLAYNMERTEQWIDNTVASGKTYYYKVIANEVSGGIAESDIKNAKAEVKDFVFVDIDNPQNKISLRWNPKISISNIRKITSRTFAGCEKPKIEKGRLKYKLVNMEFTVKKTELEYLQYLSDTAKIILFRDRRGEKIYGQISSDINNTYEIMDKVNINFTFTELNFIEKDIYKGSA